jgi:hypothetical protein
VAGATNRAGSYPDSQQYIHASSILPQATDFWYYDRLGNDRAGIALEIDLNAADCELLADPRSEDGIIQATRIDPQQFRRVISLPSVSEMQKFLLSQGWICEESAVTMTLTCRSKGLTASTSGFTLPGAWRKFYRSVKAGTPQAGKVLSISAAAEKWQSSGRETL